MNTTKSTFIRSLSHFGFFRIWGKDAAALLHHLTTNDINAMKPGQCLEAVLLTNKARCLDVLTVLRRDEDFLVITSPNRREMFLPHARTFIVFRQDIQIEDITGRIFCTGVFGPAASTSLTAPAPETGSIAKLEINGIPVSISHTSRLPHGGYLILSDQSPEPIEAALQLPSCDNETYNILRVEAGVPVTGLEITEAHNPWEANLNTMISLHKGCYNGQEIIARLNTYEKVKQHLKGLRLAEAIPTGAVTALQSEGKIAGEITSSVTSPRYGNIALAYVRKAYETTGTPLKVLLDGAETDAEVVDLPFQ